VGSDLDLVAIVSEASVPFEQRALSWGIDHLPVPAEILIYTENEWQKLQASGSLFTRMLATDTVWVYPQP
jgi:hypothetical protein